MIENTHIDQRQRIFQPLCNLFIRSARFGDTSSMIQPFVAICGEPQDYIPCTQEVDRLIHLPLSALTDPGSREPISFSRGRASWTSLPRFERPASAESSYYR